MTDHRSYLLILGEGAAVAWVLRESRMAFPPTRRVEVNRLGVGDELFVFTTRGCWHNPTRDRGRVIGLAEVTTPVVAYDESVAIAGWEFTHGREGVELAPLVPRLRAFPDGAGRGIRLRRPLLELPRGDATLLRQKLSTLAVDPRRTIEGYLDRAMR